jgi:hypothetical protein
MSIRLRLTLWQLCRSQLINRLLARNLVLQHGNNYQHGIRFQGGDHMIPPDAELLFAKQMNATTVSINASHASLVSHPDQTAELILNATKGTTK